MGKICCFVVVLNKLWRWCKFGYREVCVLKNIWEGGEGGGYFICY